jgi:cation transporter-like permease
LLATIRPDDWNFPLLLHVLGASILLGALIAAVTAQLLAWRRRAPADMVPYARLSFRTLLFVAIPSWFLMRLAAEWIADKEGLTDLDEDPTWLGIGYMTAEGGGVLLLISVILAGIGARRLGRSNGEKGATLVQIATVLAVILVIAYVIATWAMSGKPD